MHEVCREIGSQSSSGLNLLSYIMKSYKEAETFQTGCHAVYLLFRRWNISTSDDIDIEKTLCSPIYVGKCYDSMSRAKGHIVRATTTMFKCEPKNVKTKTILSCISEESDVIVLVVPTCTQGNAFMVESVSVDLFSAPGNKILGHKTKLKRSTKKILSNKILLFLIDKLKNKELDFVHDHAKIVKPRKNKSLCLQCDLRY